MFLKIVHFQICIFQDLTWNLADFMHEIHLISWNLPDFMAVYFMWNPADFMHEICQIPTMKSARFHEICWIPLPWNPPDFMKYTAYLAFSGRPWNLLDSTMKSGRFHMKYTAYLAFSGRQWNLPDFMMESVGFHAISPKWAKDQWSYFSTYQWR